MFKSKLGLKTALVVMVVASFAFAGGGRAFADTTDPSGNTVDASNSADQSAAAAPASVNPDPTTTNDQTDTTPDSGTPPDPTPPADPSGTDQSTDTSGTTPDSTQPPADDTTTDTPPACTPAPSDPTQGSQPDPSGSGQTATDNSAINNNICSDANSGNASVTNNTNGGNATSGDAGSTATIMNIIQSLTGLSGSDLSTFVQNIGDYTGDITLDPTDLSSALGIDCSLCGGGSLNSNVNSGINNNINLTANSGNADVSNNGSGGNATTGDATALLNLINIINSIIAANKSFIGIINIDGSLNGDILLPPDMLDSLLGSNTAPIPGSSSGSSGGGSQLNSDVNQGINNNINLAASSGDATVADNGTGGNATTGNALTKLTLLNLTGSEIIGQNALLVFINVLGSWVGMIVNAPAGTTAAALGDASAGGTCGCSGLDVNSTTNSQINNNIDLSATTGDASVTGNGTGGNATSGNATASANVVNIINSDISLSGWFGILFINVFGSWNGSFGIDTSAGDPPVLPPSSGDGSSQGSSSDIVTAVATGGGTPGYGGGGTPGGAQTPDDTNSNQSNSVLGASTGDSNGPTTAPNNKSINLLIGLIGSICCFMLLGRIERRREQQGELTVPDNGPQIITPDFV